MKEVSLDVDDVNRLLIISESSPDFLTNKDVIFYLENYLFAKFKLNHCEISYIEADKPELIDKIRKLINRLNYKESLSKGLSTQIKDVLTMEEDFKKFSDKAAKIRNNIIDVEELAKFDQVIKKNMYKHRKPYRLQLLSSYHLAFSQNACNFSVPGAGKTTIVYAAFTYLKDLPLEDNKHVDKILVIGPLSSFGPWESEYKECFGREPVVKRITGDLGTKERKRFFNNPGDTEIILISYQGVSYLEDAIKDFLKKYKVMVVLDEAHKIKNIEKGIWAETILGLSEYCKSRVVLTGTPVPNGYQDLFNLYKFIWPRNDILGFNKFQLKSLTNNPNTKIKNELTLNASPFFIRVTKKDLNLPKPIENEPIICEMGQKQKEIYSFVYEFYMRSFPRDNHKKNFYLNLQKARIIRLMQLATNPNLLKKPLDDFYKEQGISNTLFLDDTEIIEKISNYDETPTKFIIATDLIKEIINTRKEKVIVWSNFIQNIKDFQQYLKNNNIESKLLYGEIPVDSENNIQNEETRESIIREFHKPDSSFKVIIANPFAASESISLHKVCHNAIYMDRTFNAANFVQSKDRIHRYGLKDTDKINYYYLISKNTVDLRIHDRLMSKVKRMLEIIENEDIPLFKENMDLDTGTIDDIKILLSDYELGNTPKI